MPTATKTSDRGVDQAEVMNAVHGILSKTYPTFDDGDDDWITKGLSDNPFRVVVSTALSTVTHSKRVIGACNDLFCRVESFAELAALDDELRELIGPVAHYNNKRKSIKEMSRRIVEEYGGVIPADHETLMTLSGIDEMIAMIAARVIDLSILENREFDLSEVNDAFDFVGSRPGGFTNVVVVPGRAPQS